MTVIWPVQNDDESWPGEHDTSTTLAVNWPGEPLSGLFGCIDSFVTPDFIELGEGCVVRKSEIIRLSVFVNRDGDTWTLSVVLASEPNNPVNCDYESLDEALSFRSQILDAMGGVTVP